MSVAYILWSNRDNPLLGPPLVSRRMQYASVCTVTTTNNTSIDRWWRALSCTAEGHTNDCWLRSSITVRTPVAWSVSVCPGLPVTGSPDWWRVKRMEKIISGMWRMIVVTGFCIRLRRQHGSIFKFSEVLRRTVYCHIWFSVLTLVLIIRPNDFNWCCHCIDRLSRNSLRHLAYFLYRKTGNWKVSLYKWCWMGFGERYLAAVHTAEKALPLEP